MSFLQLFLLLSVVIAPSLLRFSSLVDSYEFSKFIIIVFLSSMLLFLLALKIFQGKVKIIIGKIGLMIFLMGLSYVVSTILSISPLASLIGAYGSFSDGLIFFLLLLTIFYTVSNFNSDRKIIISTIHLAGVTVGLIGIWQYIGDFAKFHNFFFRVYSLIGQPNRLAFYLLAIIPLGFFLATEEKKRTRKIIYWCGFLTLLIGLLLTFSRTTFVSLLVLGLMIFIMDYQVVSKNKKIITLCLLPLLAFTIIFVNSLISTWQDFSKSSLLLRFAELESGWTGVTERGLVRSLFGYGPDTAYLTFFKHRPILYNASTEELRSGPVQYRNYFLHILNTRGFSGLVLYLSFFIFLLDQAFKQSRKENENKGIFYGLLAIFINSLFYYQTDLVLVIFWTYAGLVISEYTKSISSRSIFYQNKIISLLLLFLATFFIYWSARFYLAQVHASGSRNEKDIAASASLNPFYDIYRRNLSAYYLSEALREKDTDKVIAKKHLDMAINVAEDALKLSPDPRNVRALLVAQYQAGVIFDKDYQHKNVEVGKKLIELSPTEPRSWDYLGLIYLNLGDLKNAREAFEREKGLQSDSPTPYLHLGEVTKQEGKIAEAIKLYETAVKLAPGWDFAENELKKAQDLLLK